ncbi:MULTISPECIES: response regulator transcription factor [unclassified Campylobacter]|uniref:response regulator transcription factor n=1 Tax=unclassified Campylobacter TaxID=2593542 RepID=UPI0022EA08CD|nr:MULTISPECIES: response regulator transcription factor [unclassified Campylobacter]MDA3056076.1 response regulator transcription factor [Campylobacter sp. CN_NA1]MDA3065221.1 response regulator transcription factor [Campylobacter sp. CN_NE4]MDA3068046.1 response regulator transcription factor [Campylobacter sp. CN_NE3]MDA3083587.1 response regulator transcription factor [Campylobacter sp. CN_NE1]MDA3086722.1 response regulator transcription factor [Campylobacter sp. CN_NA2]
MSVALKELSVLLVEDEAKIRDLLAGVMEKVFKKVITAQNGEEGLKKFKKFNPNIVITDILMPIRDGLEMSKDIRAISPETPIVVLSAFNDKDKLMQAIEIGINKYLLKPIDMDELIYAIETLAKAKIDSSNLIEIGKNYTFSSTKKVLIKNGVEIPLTKKELAFISLLINRLGTLVLHSDIKKNVWIGESVSDAAIRTFIKRVRDKVGADFIKNIPGLGYKIDTKL